MEKTSTAKYILKVSGGIVRLFLNILFYIIVAMLIIRAGTYTFNFAYQVFGSVAVSEEPGTEVEFQILKGESTMEIAGKLYVSRLIKDKYSFYVKTKLKEYNIMPGTFILNTSMDYDSILEVITDINNSIAKEQTVEDANKTP